MYLDIKAIPTFTIVCAGECSYEFWRLKLNVVIIKVLWALRMKVVMEMNGDRCESESNQANCK